MRDILRCGATESRAYSAQLQHEEPLAHERRARDQRRFRQAVAETEAEPGSRIYRRLGGQSKVVAIAHHRGGVGHWRAGGGGWVGGGAVHLHAVLTVAGLEWIRTGWGP